MSLTPQQNIMMGKIEKMRHLLVKALAKNKQCIIWTLKYNELEMVETFCLVENSDYARMEDILITFNAPFYNQKDYSLALINEMVQMQEKTKEYAKDNPWVLENWDIESAFKNESEVYTPQGFFRMLESMLRAVPEFGGKIIAHLAPSEVYNERELLSWMRESLRNGLPERLGIMISEQESKEVFFDLQSLYPETVATLKPDLKMEEAIKKMATAGNPTSPDVKFRKCIFSMSEAVAKKDSVQITNWHDKAVEVAENVGWKDMQVTAHMAAGTFMLNLKETDLAVYYYDSAIAKALVLESEGHYMGKPLVVQSYAAKGAALLSKKNYEGAGECYLGMAEAAVKLEDHLNSLEAWRLAGYCYKNLGDRHSAMECNWNALLAGEKLSVEVRPHTMLPYVGKELVDLYSKENDAQQKLLEINGKMKTLVGDEWRI